MTQNTRNCSLSLFASLALLASASALAQSDSYPVKPITIVVGYPPGGSTDLTGRTIGVELSKRLGVPVVIENIGGAGGAIGAQKVVNAAPDGYTLLAGANNEIAISRLVSAAVKYQTKDFTPIGLIASTSPNSKTLVMFPCVSGSAIFASLTNSRMNSGSAESAGRIRLTTRIFSPPAGASSRARKTSAMPPFPMRDRS